MTLLRTLVEYHAQHGSLAQPGWSSERFGWCVVLDREGAVVGVENLNDLSGKRPRPVRLLVPAAVKRTMGVAANFLWDKCSYVLGRATLGSPRTQQEHAAFVALNLARLAGERDEGLVAFVSFLRTWTPDRFDVAPFSSDMLDANIMFRLSGDQAFLHERPAARALLELDSGGVDVEQAPCLTSGVMSPLARLHPAIKGVDGAQASGGALISFNLEASTSYRKFQGGNAPTSQSAASRYGAALNHLLASRDNRLRRTVGGVTTVFWAQGSSPAAAAAEKLLQTWLGDEAADLADAVAVQREMRALLCGRNLVELRRDIAPATCVHVLGLSPNAARLSVRYWVSASIEEVAMRLAWHHADLAVEPSPPGWGKVSINWLLARTVAFDEKFENIPPNLAAEVMRSALTGSRYPSSLMMSAIARLRAGDDPARGWHAAVIRAVLERDHRHGFIQEGVPARLAPDNGNMGYQLGRLFAVLESARGAALRARGGTARSRYWGLASSAPASAFPLLLRQFGAHLASLPDARLADALSVEASDIRSKVPGELPRALPLSDQGRFVVGFYHQVRRQLSAEPFVSVRATKTMLAGESA